MRSIVHLALFSALIASAPIVVGPAADASKINDPSKRYEIKKYLWKKIEAMPRSHGCRFLNGSNHDDYIRLHSEGPEEAATLVMRPFTSPENVVYNLGVVIAQEFLDFYTALLDPAFIFRDCLGVREFTYEEDQERMRRLFAGREVLEIDLVIAPAEPCTLDAYPAENGFVQVPVCWRRVDLGDYVGFREQPSLYVLRLTDPPDSQPSWKIVYWLDRAWCDR